MTRQGNRVLVTGATGVIGHWTLPLLIERGFEVHATSHGNLSSGPGSSATMHGIDLLDDDAVSGLLGSIRPTHLLHLAWITRPQIYMTAPENQRWLESGRTMFRLAADLGCRRIVAAGSCAEYDWAHSPCNERLTPLRHDTPYASAKNDLRLALQDLAAGSGPSWAWGRIFHLFGPRENPKRFVPYVIRCALTNETILCSHGRQVRDYTYAADLASAFVSLLESGVEGTINLGSGHQVTLRGIVEAVLATVPSFSAGVQYGVVDKNPSDPISLVPDLSRLHSELHWRPVHSLESGLRLTIDWWQTHLLSKRVVP
ncbi:MAG: NAD(P)-dependent oxidoreductase [Betaproteobacteria bacterium]|nr:NAD(P)-dependent oxidoreductase [Betaproteobacteria bacterium]